jgi:hypothetical protein
MFDQFSLVRGVILTLLSDVNEAVKVFWHAT